MYSFIAVFYRLLCFSSLCFIATSCSHSKEKNTELAQDTTSSYQSNIDEIYTKLDTILSEKEAHLKEYLNTTKKIAKKAGKDATLISFFTIKNEYYSLMQDTIVPQSIVDNINKLKENINSYYLLNYLNFYDILFVNKLGDIIYTIRKESDYHKNIFKGTLQNTVLSKRLKETPSQAFVDFTFFRASGEPSAFFVEPIHEKDSVSGWIILQCSIDKINSIFAEPEDLGQTGELLLVNKDNYLLTNSRFNVEPTILKQKLPHKNIASKFQERKGHKSVTDYRDNEVYSAFKVFPFLESEWLIIAKIDKSEVFTNYFEANKTKYYPLMETRIKQHTIKETNKISPDSSITVHMDEYKRADTTVAIATQGLVTCTGVNITYPQHFSYIAHISPYDKIYNESKTDIINKVLKHISYFDITKSELHNIHFNVMSAQIKSLPTLIDILIGHGYFLNQISFSYNPNAQYGNMYSNCNTNTCIFEWQYKHKIVYEDARSTPSLEDILKLDL